MAEIQLNSKVEAQPIHSHNTKRSHLLVDDQEMELESVKNTFKLRGFQPELRSSMQSAINRRYMSEGLISSINSLCPILKQYLFQQNIRSLDICSLLHFLNIPKLAVDVQILTFQYIHIEVFLSGFVNFYTEGKIGFFLQI